MVTEWDADTIRHRVRQLAQAEGTPVSARHIALVCHDLFAAAGVGILLVADDGTMEPVYATTDAVERMIELEVTLGEGPADMAAAGGHAVLVDDLPGQRARWPLFTNAAAAAQVRAVLTFPMWADSSTVGAVEIYLAQENRPTAAELHMAWSFVELLTDQVVAQLDAAAQDTHAEFALERFHSRWQAVHQATGVASVQLRCGMPEAVLRLRSHAFATDRRLTDVAQDVVDGVLRLTPNEPVDPDLD